MIDVSVVIPTYNPGQLIDGALSSVLAQQTSASVEIIVVDDGSRDGTPERLRSQYPSVRVVEQKNAGTAAARNTGLAAANGRYVALLDQDDTWEPSKLDRQIALFERPAVGMVHTGGRFVNPAGETTSVAPGRAGLDVHALLGWCWIVQSSALIKTDLLRSIGGFDTGLSAADDWDLWIRLAAVSELEVVTDPLVSVLVHPGNQSNDAERMYAAAAGVIAKHRHLHPGCAACRSARREASVRNRREYYRRTRDVAKDARRHGRYVDSAATTVRAVARHPRSVLETSQHHLRRFSRRPLDPSG